ncbi:MAG TPA: hypothetical protein PKD53_15725 [Chloroflexaceae bacterium]|nr:hypothetical protein [Chloroflexaceae bacterium]
MGTRPMKRRLAEWLRRYGPAELLSLAAILSASWLALALTDSVPIAALVGTWTEGLVYYGVMAGRELRARGRATPAAALRAARDLLLEFGPSELLDSLLVRPAALAAGLALAPSPALGALAGKLAADLVFYVPTIASYEQMRRWRAKGEEAAPC